MTESKFLKTVGNTIKLIRKEKNFNLYKIAKSTNLSITHIKNIENGKVDCYLTTIINICNSLEIDIYNFFEKANL